MIQKYASENMSSTQTSHPFGLQFKMQAKKQFWLYIDAKCG